MTIDWGSLGVVTIVSFAVAVLVVVLVSLALVGRLSRVDVVRHHLAPD